jgi:hypothetical protein
MGLSAAGACVRVPTMQPIYDALPVSATTQVSALPEMPDFPDSWQLWPNCAMFPSHERRLGDRPDSETRNAPGIVRIGSTRNRRLLLREKAFGSRRDLRLANHLLSPAVVPIPAM